MKTLRTSAHGRLVAGLTVAATALGLMSLAAPMAAADDASNQNAAAASDIDAAGTVSASLTLQSTTTEGITPAPELGQVPVNGGGGVYELKIHALGENVEDTTLRIPLGEGFYWVREKIAPLASTGSEWDYELKIDWDDCVTIGTGDDQKEMCSTLIMTFPRIDETSIIPLELPFTTVQTEAAQAGDVMEPPTVTWTDADGEHQSKADQGVEVVSTPRPLLQKSVGSAGVTTKMVDFGDGDGPKLATAFRSTIKVGGIATELGGRPASLAQPLVLQDNWSIAPATTQVFTELECVTYADPAVCGEAPAGASVTVDMGTGTGSGSGSVTLDGFAGLPAAGSNVTSVQLLHWVPADPESSSVLVKTTLTNKVTSDNWKDVDGTEFAELTAQDNGEKGPAISYVPGGWRIGSQEYIDQEGNLMIPGNVLQMFNYNNANVSHGHYEGCRYNLRTTFDYGSWDESAWRDGQWCPDNRPIWSPGSKFVSTMDYSAPTLYNNVVSPNTFERFGAPDQPILFDFWNPAEQQILPDVDMVASVGARIIYNGSNPAPEFKIANLSTDPELFTVQYGSGDNCAQPDVNGKMANPIGALTWYDSIDQGGGASKVCGVKVQFLGDASYLGVKGSLNTIASSQSTNNRNYAFSASVPFKLVAPLDADKTLNDAVHEYMAGTDGDGNPLVTGGTPDNPTYAQNGVGGADSYIRPGDYYLTNSIPKYDEVAGTNAEIGQGEKVSKYNFTPGVAQYPGLDNEFKAEGLTYTVKVPGPVSGVAVPKNPEGWTSQITGNNTDGYTIEWTQASLTTVPAPTSAKGTPDVTGLPEFPFDVKYSFRTPAKVTITSFLSDGKRGNYAGTEVGASAEIKIQVGQPTDYQVAKNVNGPVINGVGDARPGDTVSWELSWFAGVSKDRNNLKISDVLPHIGDERGSTSGAKLVSATLSGDGEAGEGTIWYRTSADGQWTELPEAAEEIAAIEDIYEIEVRIPKALANQAGSLIIVMQPDSEEDGARLVNNLYEGGNTAQKTANAEIVIREEAPEPGVIVPVAPTLAEAACGVEPVVTIPEMPGVKYLQVRDGDVLTVTAEPTEGFVFAEGAVSEWTFNLGVQPCPFAVSFDLNGGEGDFPDIEVLPGGTVTIHGHVPTRDGFEFLGWLPSDAADSSGLKQPGQTHSPAGPMVFVAQWEAPLTPPGPGTGGPETGGPETGGPETGGPETGGPEKPGPGTGEPGTDEPDTELELGLTKPVTPKPAETSKPSGLAATGASFGWGLLGAVAALGAGWALVRISRRGRNTK